MFRRLMLTLGLVATMTLASSSYSEQQTKEPPLALAQAAKPLPPIKHARGHKSPKNLGFLKKLSELRHGATIRRLPRATAATYDCRTLGIVGPVKDQGQCGSCWDFSGTCVVECCLYKNGVLKSDGSQALSEQFTLDCGSNGGCNGDDNTTVLAWAKAKGLPQTAAYGPYQAQAGTCNYTSSMALYEVTDWGFVDGTGNGVTSTQLIKNAMVAYGPIGCGVAAGNDWDNYTNGTITGTSNDIDHDVVMIGWDDTHDNGDGTKGAWIVRNSWNSSWGCPCANTLNPSPVEGGYAWIKYGGDSIGTESVFATYTVTPGPTPPTPVPPTPVPPVPPAPPVPPTPTSGFSGTVTSTYTGGTLVTIAVTPASGTCCPAKPIRTAKQIAAKATALKALKAVNPTFSWEGLIEQLDQMVIEFGPQAAVMIQQLLSTMNLSPFELTILNFLVQVLLGSA